MSYGEAHFIKKVELYYIPSLMHSIPLPRKPALQLHSNPLKVLLQAAFTSQLWIPSEHSFWSREGGREGGVGRSVESESEYE